MPTYLRILTAAALAAVCSTVLIAAPPVFWTVSTQADFLKGTVDGVAIDAEGRLRLGPSVEPFADAQQPFVWSIAPAGSGWLAGTGNDGKVLKIDSAGGSTLAFDAAELAVHAVLADGRGGFYAATGPDGRVHHVDGAGNATVLFDPPDRYIWALARGADGSVYVGTGDRGIIYRVRPGQPGEILYRTRAANVIALAVDAAGHLYAGTSTPGRLFRVDSSGRAFVIIDSPHQEIRGLRLASDGALYAAGLTPGPPEEGTAGESAPVPTVTAQVGGVAVGESAAATAGGSSDSKRAGRGTIYVVRDDKADVVWETGQETPYDLIAGPESGSVIVATGSNGRLYQLNLSASPASVLLLGRIEARQITQAARGAGGEIVLAGSNPGRLFRLRADRAATGTFESEIRDAGTAARWGSIRWRATGPGTVRISTRSGNTSRPDDTWSDWSAPYASADGTAITSPSARYLQWRATLTAGGGGSPELTSVTVAYLPRNLRPAVTSLTVHPPGLVFQRPFSSNDTEIAGFDGSPAADDTPAQETSGPAVGRKMYRKGLQTFQWRAEDPNGDRLTYSIAYRREGESGWRPLRSGLPDPIFVWDTTSVPDGRYVVRVAAADSVVNAPAEALEGSRESEGFDIDNAAPVISIAPAAPGAPHVVRVTVRDGHSGVLRVEYALGGERWQLVYPADGLSDSREESFEITLPTAADRARLVIRASDVFQNVATAAAGR